MTRIAVLSDVHGNALALEAVRKAVHASAPDFVAVAVILSILLPETPLTGGESRRLKRTSCSVCALRCDCLDWLGLNSSSTPMKRAAHYFGNEHFSIRWAPWVGSTGR